MYFSSSSHFVYFSLPPPLGSVCRLYFAFEQISTEIYHGMALTITSHNLILPSYKRIYKYNISLCVFVIFFCFKGVYTVWFPVVFVCLFVFSNCLQIASYEEINPFAGKITLVSLPGKVMFHCEVTRLCLVIGRPNCIQMSLILRWRPPNPYKVSNFFRFLKAFYMVAILQQNHKIGKLTNFNLIFLVADFNF